MLKLGRLKLEGRSLEDVKPVTKFY
jgi:hypothetical protein